MVIDFDLISSNVGDIVVVDDDGIGDDDDDEKPGWCGEAVKQHAKGDEGNAGCDDTHTRGDGRTDAGA